MNFVEIDLQKQDLRKGSTKNHLSLYIYIHIYIDIYRYDMLYIYI